MEEEPSALSKADLFTDPPRLVLGHAGVLIVCRPRNHGLGILRRLHALQQPQVVEEAHQLVSLVVAEAIAAPVLHKLKLGVDPLADRRRRRLRQHEACERLQGGCGRGWLQQSRMQQGRSQ